MDVDLDIRALGADILDQQIPIFQGPVEAEGDVVQAQHNEYPLGAHSRQGILGAHFFSLIGDGYHILAAYFSDGMADGIAGSAEEFRAVQRAFIAYAVGVKAIGNGVAQKYAF